MRHPDRARNTAFVAAAIAACLVLPAPLAAQGVTVALTPAAVQVDPGGEFDLDLFVTQAGAPFNGFDADIGFDPAALTLVPASPTSLQQGTLVTAACDNTFHVFSLGTGSAAISDAMLCPDTFVTGPGQLYRLHFHASTTAQATTVRFLPGLQFYNAGLFVNPANSTDATVQIGASSVGVDPSPGGPALRLSLAPNPMLSSAAITVELGGTARATVRVLDASGRLERTFEAAAGAPGPHTFRWDGRDASGRRVGPGIHFVIAEQAGRMVSTRLALLR